MYVLEIVALVGAFRVKGLSGITEDRTDLNSVLEEMIIFIELPVWVTRWIVVGRNGRGNDRRWSTADRAWSCSERVESPHRDEWPTSVLRIPDDDIFLNTYTTPIRVVPETSGQNLSSPISFTLRPHLEISRSTTLAMTRIIQLPFNIPRHYFF